MKKKSILLLVIMILITCYNVYWFAVIPIKNEIEELADMGDEIYYDNFSIKIEDINLLLEDSISGYIYIGRDTCPACLKLNIAIQKEFEKNEDLIIYKFDTDIWREDKDYQAVIDKYNVVEVPLLMKIDQYGAVSKTLTVKEADMEQLSVELENFFHNI